MTETRKLTGHVKKRLELFFADEHPQLEIKTIYEELYENGDNKDYKIITKCDKRFYFNKTQSDPCFWISY